MGTNEKEYQNHPCKEKMIIRSGLINDKRLAEAKKISKMTTRSQTSSTIVMEIDEKKEEPSNMVDKESILNFNETNEVQKMIAQIENQEKLILFFAKNNIDIILSFSSLYPLEVI